MPILTHSLRPTVFATAILLLALAGCSNPLGDDVEVTPEAAEAQSTRTPAPPMRIVTPTPVDATAVAAATQAPTGEDRPETYVVQENDTLYGIAAQFNVEISRLVELNGLADPNDIWVGQELVIPPLE
jgi:LysM repeat protein